MNALHEIWPAGFYCGPSVIAAITGADCREVRGWINEVRHRPLNRGVTGLSNTHLIGTLASRGYALVEVIGKAPSPSARRGRWAMLPTLAEAVAGFDPAERYIVNISGHYVAVQEGQVFDNHVRFGLPIEKHPSRRARVKRAWRIA